LVFKPIYYLVVYTIAVLHTPRVKIRLSFFGDLAVFNHKAGPCIAQMVAHKQNLVVWLVEKTKPRLDLLLPTTAKKGRGNFILYIICL
jgi:hypothetical protein